MSTQTQGRHVVPPHAAKYQDSGRNYESTTYGREHLKLYREIRNQEIARAIDESNSGEEPLRILEVGCGTGIVLEYLLGLPKTHDVTGLDGSATMLEQAAERFAEASRKPQLLLGSADSLPFSDGEFDVVIATRFIHLFDHPHKKRIFGEFQRVLRQGGIRIVEFYARPYGWFRYHCTSARRKPRDAYFDHYPTRRQVKDIVGCSFQRRPVRLVGARLLHRLLGASFVRGLTRHVPLRNVNPVVDEYLVVTRK